MKGIAAVSVLMLVKGSSGVFRSVCECECVCVSEGVQEREGVECGRLPSTRFCG